MRGLGFLSRRWLLQRKARTLLTGSGIALGVALLFGTLITAESSTRGFQQVVDAASGGADVIISPAGTFGLISPGAATLNPDLVSSVGEVPGVARTAGIFGFSTVVEGSAGETTPFVANQGAAAGAFGLDFGGVGGIYDFELDDGRLPASGAEVVVPGRLVRDIEATTGSDVVLGTPSGNRRARVVGVLADTGAGLLNQGNAVFMPLETAQTFAGAGPDDVSVMLVGLEDGVEANGWVDQAVAAMGPGANVQPIGEVFEVFSRLLAGMSGIYTASSTMVVLVAGFLVYLTLSMAVIERTRLYGTLYALGARRSQIRRVVLSEALVLGACATAAGLLLGLGLPYLLLPITRRITGEFVFEQIIPVWALLVAAAFGILVSAGSALVPARRAARIDPVESMRGDFASQARLSRGWMVGAIALAVGLLLSGLGGGGPLSSILGDSETGRMAIALPFMLFGALALLPPILRPLARLLGRLTSRIARGVGEVAVFHLSMERTRSAYTLGLVMVVVAIAMIVGASRSSFTGSVERNMDQLYGADFILYAASTFDEGFTESLTEVPGVRSVTPEHLGASQLLRDGGREPVQIRLIDPAGYFGVSSFEWKSGDEDAAGAALGAGGGVVLGEATADRLGVGVGGSIELQTTEGPRPFAVAAVAVVSNAIPTMYLGATDAALFGFRDPTTLHVLVDHGVDAEAVQGAVEGELGDRATFITVTVGDIKADIRAQIAAGLNGTLVLLLLTGVVGMFGLANTLAMSVQERYREIGILRSIGVRRGQLVGMTLVESATLVAVALLIGVPLGVLLSRLTVPFVVGVLGDMTVSYMFPWGIVPILGIAAILVAVFASVGPARRAASIEIEEALRVE